MHVPTDDPIQTHIDDYVNVMAQSRDLIQDSRIRFVFIHFPIPHPPGIYDRVHHVLRNDGSYLDNLALADQSLAELREAIQSTPAAANTTLIVSSDHSWRQWVWQPLKSEGERATHGGKFDPRPVLMVHLPGSDTGQVIAKPVNVLVVHPILEGLLRGQIRTPADLADVVNRQPQASENVQGKLKTQFQQLCRGGQEIYGHLDAFLATANEHIIRRLVENLPNRRSLPLLETR